MLLFVIQMSHGRVMLLGKYLCKGWQGTGEFSDPCESKIHESAATRQKGDRRNLEKRAAPVSVFHFLDMLHPCTHHPGTV